MNQNTKYAEIDIRELISLLLKKCWIIILCIFISAGLTGYYSYARLTDYYRATATVYLGKEGLGSSIDLGMISLNNYLMSDYINLFQSRMVADEVIKRMDTNVPAGMIQSGISAYMPEDQKILSRMFQVSYQSTNPAFAADVVNNTCEVVLEKASGIFGVKNAQIIDRALVPEYPIGPNRKKNMIIAAGVGFILGIIIIFILEFMTYAFRKPEDIERLLGLTVLGIIPEFKGDARNSNKTKGLNHGRL